MVDETQAPTRKSRAERLDEVHKRAMQRFDDIWGVVKDERLQCLSDRRFATIRGAQWEGQYAFGAPVDDEGEAIDTGLPRMEIPKVHKSLVRIFSEYRNNRVSVDFRPRGDDSDRGSADNLDGLYRADENDTRGGGQDAYDNAFDESIGGGFGGWRLRTRYEDESDEANEHQRIGIEPIYDADQSLFFDLDAKHQDKSDARFAFLLVSMSRSAFEAEYPDHSPTTFEGKLGWNYDWVSGDTITVAEYYEVSDGSILRRTFRNIGTQEERTEDDKRLTAEDDDGRTLEDDLLATGWEEIRSRRIKRPRVRKYILSGAECLDDMGYIAGPNIPLVPMYGKRWYIDGIERCMGHTRLAIDASRIYNMMVSSLTEASAASPIARPIFDPEQVQGLEDSWARANIDRAPYSLARVLYDADGKPIQIGPITVLNPPSVAPNVAALLQVAGGDIADLTGETEQAEQVPANTSAQAIELVHSRADVRTFIYFDNLRKAMQRSGEIWLGMAKEIYVEEGREMIAVDAEGKQSKVKIAEPAMDQQGGQMLKNDLTAGRYEVIVDVGPASRSRKDATVKAMLGIAETAAPLNPGLASACLGVAIINMDGEGLDGIRDMQRREGIAGGWIQPTEQEAAEIAQAKANQPPQEDPNATIANAQKAIAEAEVMKANIAAQDSNTKVIVAQAQSQKAQADAAATLAGIDRDDRDQVLKAVEASTKVEAHERDTAHRTIDATMAVERHDRDMSPQQGNDDGNAA